MGVFLQKVTDNYTFKGLVSEFEVAQIQGHQDLAKIYITILFSSPNSQVGYE